MVNHQELIRKINYYSLRCTQEVSFLTGLDFSMPTFVILIITHRCNARCKHCYIWKKKTSEELTSKDWFSTLDALQGWLGPVLVSITGGEPLLKENMIHILRHAVELGLEVAKILSASKKALNFLVVGEGYHLNKLLDLTNRLKVNGNVHFLGLRNDTNEILKETDIFVCPSVWDEAFGFVIAEAMGCGKPVVASNVGGIPELVEDGITGILIPPAKPADLAKAITTLLKNNEGALRMGRAGRKRAEEYFDVKMWVDKTIALYEGCLAT